MKQERLIIIKELYIELDNKTIFPNQAADAFNDYFIQITHKLNTEHTRMCQYLAEMFFYIFS